jgi:hypothetical protein
MITTKTWKEFIGFEAINSLKDGLDEFCFRLLVICLKFLVPGQQAISKF